MAKNATEESAGGTVPANNPDAALQSGFGQMYDLDKQINSAIEKHVKPLRDEKSELTALLKERTGIERKDINAVYGIFKRAKSTLEMDDEDHGAEVRSNLQLAWEAIFPGDQLDFMQAFDAVEQARKSAVATAQQEAVH